MGKAEKAAFEEREKRRAEQKAAFEEREKRRAERAARRDNPDARAAEKVAFEERETRRAERAAQIDNLDARSDRSSTASTAATRVDVAPRTCTFCGTPRTEVKSKPGKKVCSDRCTTCFRKFQSV